jgi:predicted alpha/beta superfamily hydrolase
MLSRVRRMLALAGLALPTLVPLVPVRAQNAMPAWTEIAIKSAKLGEDRKIFVALPFAYKTATRRYPVLVLLDANDRPQFMSAITNVAFLASRRAIEPLIIVGVPNGKDRTKDMTPPATAANAKQFPTAGGADHLLDFIVDEALPKVREQYRTTPYTILAGHSFGGLFSLYVAAMHPGAFNAIVAMSPSIWWNDTTVVRPYAERIAHSTKPLRLFEGSGAYERPIDGPTKQFVALLDSLHPALVANRYRHYPDNSHGLMPVPSLMDGLRFVFEPVSLATTAVDLLPEHTDSASVISALRTVETTYVRGAHELGMEEKLPEAFAHAVGTEALTYWNLPKVGAQILRENLKRYPESAKAHADMGDAMLATGDTAAARTHFHEVVALGAAVPAPLLKDTRDKLSKLDQTVQAGKPKPK